MRLSSGSHMLRRQSSCWIPMVRAWAFPQTIKSCFFASFWSPIVLVASKGFQGLPKQSFGGVFTDLRCVRPQGWGSECDSPSQTPCFRFVGMAHGSKLWSGFVTLAATLNNTSQTLTTHSIALYLLCLRASGAGLTHTIDLGSQLRHLVPTPTQSEGMKP